MAGRLNHASSRHAVAALAVLLLLLALAGVAGAAANETFLVSRQSTGDGGAGGDGSSIEAAISPEGRYISFESSADNLSSEDNNSFTNIFLRDTVGGTTTLINRQSASDGGAAADATSSTGGVSADGRYVAFESDADNLSTADSNLVRNVFVRDTVTNTTTLVSRQSASDGGAGGDSSSSDAVISADGRYVAFHSDANNLSTADSNAVTNAFVRDTVTNTTILISRQSPADGGAGADGSSFDTAISPDGRYVAYQSDANNLSTADNDAVRNDFVRDLVTGTTNLASRQSAADGGAGGNAGSGDVAVSDDGHVVFRSDANNLSAEDNDAVSNIFVYDLLGATTTLVSRQSAADGGAGAGDHSFEVSISGDGRYATFQSDANNLSALDNDLYTNAFVRDLETATTTLVSRQSAVDGGTGADGFSTDTAVSGDGRYVAFQSSANNLSSEDNDAVVNVFVRDVRGPPPPPPPPPPPASPPPSTPPVTPPATNPVLSVKLSKGPLTVRGKRVGLTLSCPAAMGSIGCGGTIRIYLARSVFASRRSRPESLFAKGRFELTAGRRKKVRVRISRRARPLVLHPTQTAHRLGRRKARVSFKLRSPDGRKRTITQKRKLRFAPSR
jgi:hypothetical protein